MKKLALALIIVAAVALAGGTLYLFLAPAAAPTPRAAAESIRVTLSIEGAYDRRAETVAGSATALDLLTAAAAADPSLALTTKEYPGLGVLVTGMAGKENGAGGKYWQYTVNGVAPQVGAGQFALHEGDQVEWFFASSQE